MEIYNEQMERIEHPDLTKGRLENGVRTVHHPAVEGVQEVWHYETVAEYPNGGKDVKRVIDVAGVAAKAAWTQEIPIKIYRPYTKEELDAAKAEQEQAEQASKAQATRVAALEERLAAYEEAYMQGVNEA